MATVWQSPSLVSVLTALIFRARNLDHVGLVSDINDGERILVVAKANFVTEKLDVRASVDNTLGIVHVTIVTVTSNEFGLEGVLDVYNVKASRASSGANGVRKASFLIDDKVVG